MESLTLWTSFGIRVPVFISRRAWRLAPRLTWVSAVGGSAVWDKITAHVVAEESRNRPSPASMARPRRHPGWWPWVQHRRRAGGSTAARCQPVLKGVVHRFVRRHREPVKSSLIGAGRGMTASPSCRGLFWSRQDHYPGSCRDRSWSRQIRLRWLSLCHLLLHFPTSRGTESKAASEGVSSKPSPRVIQGWFQVGGF
jgi:hypothetical protein